MLLSACQTYFTQWDSDNAQIMDLLNSCLEVLRFCSESDFVAGRFLDLLTPLVVDIQSFHGYGSLQGSNRMVIGYVLNHEQPEELAMKRILGRLLGLMSIERRKIWI